MLRFLNRRLIADFFLGRKSVPANLQQPNILPDSLTPASELLDSDGPEETGPAAFFPDKPSAHDYLDFHSYAATLADLIVNAQTPLTVGVFGAWGSGKTTLMRMIESSLREVEKGPDAKSFLFVRFDAWKYYKEDALWRAMLLRVLDVLRPELKDESKSKLRKSVERLEESLYRDVEWKEKGGLTIDWPKLAKAGTSGALKLTFAFVPGVATLAKAVEAAQAAIGKGDISGDVSSVAEAFQRDLISYHQSQLLHIDQFQNKFSKLVRTHFANKRLVVFVDDLDRCLPEKAIEVLEAIKLFLDVEGCVFVLGIDQEVITRGLEARYKDIAADGQNPTFSTRYIEKLIQLPFHLPPIEAREVGSYLKQLKVDWPHEDCAQVFAEALSPNPRQIKRTINVFMLLWKLAQRRRSSIGEAVTPLRLAKVVILQTAYPKVFDHLKLNGLLLKQLELLSRATELTDQNVDPVLAEAVTHASLKKLFQLLPDDESANFAALELDELTAFFSLARRAPVVTASVVGSVTATANPVVQIAQEVHSVDSLALFQMRSPVADFVGRNEEVSRMVTALRQGAPSGFVTGMPGIGKTEFAFQVAAMLRSDFPDAQLFVDMQGTSEPPRDPGQALSACIRAFVGPDRDLPEDIEALEKIYRSLLIDRRALIVLDDVANAAQVRPLLPPTGSALLITSRNALVLPRMVSVSLGQLSPAEALGLFKGISPNVPDETAVKICSLCGYLPPAVRAAASMLAATPDLEPDTYAQQLSDEQKRIELLGNEGVNITLEASFSLSYSRLPEETQRVLKCLSVFPDTFDAHAEEKICEDPDHARLSDLIKLSLVSYDSEDKRYRLHSLMRLFAQRQLTEAEKEDIGNAHAAYYVQVVKVAGALYRQAGDDLLKGLTLFDRERENIDAGFEWSAARYTTGAGIASICSDYPRYASQILQLREPPKARISWFTRGLEAARVVADVEAQVVHLIGSGGAHRKLGQKDRAFAIYTEARDLATQAGLPQLRAEILSSLGVEHRDRGEIQQALNCFTEQLAISRELGNQRGVSLALINLANVRLTTGEIDRATQHCEEAIAISRELGDLQTEGLASGTLGRAFYLIGKPDAAIELYRRQIEVSQQLRDQTTEAGAHFNVGLALEEKGEFQQAIERASIALKIYEELESPNEQTVRAWLAELNAQRASTDRVHDTT
jgi:tetratricopeptide (TPR) repeat protein